MSRLDAVVAVLGAGFPPSTISVGALFEIQTSPTDYAIVTEIAFTLPTVNNAGTVQNTYGIGIPAVRGIGINGQVLRIEDTGNNSTIPAVQVFTSWSKTPTIPTTFFRRMSGQTASTASFGGDEPTFFRFPRGLKMLPSTSLVCWLIATGNTAGTYIGYDVSITMDA